jgi:hypothetical protein
MPAIITLPLFEFTSKIALDFSTNGVNPIVAAVVGKRVKVLQLILMSAADVNVTFQNTDNTALSGPLPMGVKGNGFVMPYTGLSWFETSVGKGLQITLNSSVQMSGWMSYVQE